MRGRARGARLGELVATEFAERGTLEEMCSGADFIISFVSLICKMILMIIKLLNSQEFLGKCSEHYQAYSDYSIIVHSVFAYQEFYLLSHSPQVLLSSYLVTSGFSRTIAYGYADCAPHNAKDAVHIDGYVSSIPFELYKTGHSSKRSVCLIRSLTASSPMTVLSLQ